MRTYTYTVSEQSPKIFKDRFALETAFTADNATTLAEAIDTSREGGAWYQDEASVVTKAEAQRNISAVHRAAAWLEKEAKAGKAHTADEVQDKIRSFRYGELRVRGEGGPKAPTAEVKAKARKFDASQAALLEKVLVGKFGKTALGALVEADLISIEQVRDAVAASDAAGTAVPDQVRQFAQG